MAISYPQPYVAWLCTKCGTSGKGYAATCRCDEEEKMAEQMEQVWRSKDGKCTGSKEEVEAYLKSLSPLSKMRFPYRCSNGGYISSSDKTYAEDKEIVALTAFANLAEEIEELRKEWEKYFPDWRTRETERWGGITQRVTVNLLLAYEEALKEVPL